jgi:hypothetical protein
MGPGREEPLEVFLLTSIHWAHLDTFWDRKPSMVAQNSTTMRNIIHTCQERFGVKENSIVDPQGPHQICDTFGMLMACVLLDHSLKKGFNAPTVQFETSQKNRLALLNYDHTTSTAEELQLH